MMTVALLLLPGLLQLGSAQVVGLVCLAPSGAGGCPAPPVTITGTVGGQVNVDVLVQGSDSFSGFDITLLGNITSVKPAGVAISNSVLVGGTVVLECIGNVLKVGPRCSPTDTANTIHLSMVGPAGFLTQFPTSGLLFSAIYNVTGTVSKTLGYQTGCSNSSVAGTSLCVQFANGALSGPIETVQTATYTQAPSPTFTLSSSQNMIALAKTQTANTTITFVSLNGFAGTV
ncbi:MAG TPA: hypothetical protein VK667_03360, partial [Ktedonobacteraceae bacterium]|nr:hypothetical protein [Ktedonobacteraceae bacterium]